MNEEKKGKEFWYRFQGHEYRDGDLKTYGKQKERSSEIEPLIKLTPYLDSLNVPRKSEEIRKKYQNEEPSLILHIHKYHFRFEQQDGAFTYNGPVKAILHYIRMELIPPDCLEVFQSSNIKFYDGCLTVRIIDHRHSNSNESNQFQSSNAASASKAPPSSSSSLPNNVTNASNAPNTEASIHSPVPASTKASSSPPVYYTVLRPTPETLYQDLCLLSESLAGQLSDENILDLESKILVASEPPLVLTPATSKPQMIHILNQLADAPPPSKRKRQQGSAQLAGEEAERLEKENLLLLMDDQRNHDFQPTFQRLQFIENVRRKRAILQQRQQLQQQQQQATRQEAAASQISRQQQQQQQMKQRRTTTPKTQRQAPPPNIHIPPVQSTMQKQAFPAAVPPSMPQKTSSGTFPPSTGPASANSPVVKREQHMDMNRIRQLAILFQQRAAQMKARGMTREQITELLNQQAAVAGTDLPTIMTVARNIHLQQLQLQQQQQQMKSERP
ncbi:SAGA complex subunit Spt20 [Schizosaccharomyces cryophilus OY26]|uniref:SAGA complex subunit Spt20 n=1 Tax=Schizosaccharomyces cryophilus (strain OY26 / ATCC MYA-4695 / CBS 11777 / NBRC 106824 / NRRL Y48691) TaxID=653667 RepID=S9W3P5_SCHCR|nr:SAGA complex subunit Spt20 [Schizosaccharomyces cryophilus OY26]EPY53164.1 SAGA complex subunit Spt20 [Schizosaccharomyces cryophilus OY26]